MSVMNKYFYLILLLSYSALGHEKTFKGTYSWGGEVDSFSSCGDSKSYWVSHGWGSINANLRKFYSSNTNKPYQPIYIEFSGHFHYEEEDGFAASYDGTVHISKIDKLEKEIPNECKQNS